MLKRWIKIIILFIFMVSIFIGGWHMYKNLEYNRQSFTINIYDYIPPQIVKVINVNKEHKLDELALYDQSLKRFITLSGNNVSFPLTVCKSEDGKKALIFKTTMQQCNNITGHISKKASLPYPPLKKNYKDKAIYIYNLPENKFIVYTTHNGIAVISDSYKLIKEILDTDPENTFFSDKLQKNEIKNLLNDVNPSIFIRQQQDILAFNYVMKKDTIFIDGYGLIKEKRDSMLLNKDNVLNIMNIPDSIHINYTKEMSSDENLYSFQIKLNKMH